VGELPPVVGSDFDANESQRTLLGMACGWSGLDGERGSHALAQKVAGYGSEHVFGAI